MVTQTSDVYDANAPLFSISKLRVLLPLFQPYRRRRAFNGHVVILKTFGDNALAIDTILEAKAQGVPLGGGKVLEIDGRGSLGRSMVAVGV